MPIKPKLTRKNRAGKVVPNPKATAYGGHSRRTDASHPQVQNQLPGALQLGNADIVAWVSECYLQDIVDGRTTRCRFTRVMAATIARFNCSRSTAMRAYRDAELLRFADAESRRPQLRDRVEEQLQRIADREEEREPMASIAALREVARIGGLYAPQTITIVPNEQLDLEKIVSVLGPSGKAALDVLLEDIERARSQGLLPAAGGTAEQIVDAEIVEPDPGTGN